MKNTVFKTEAKDILMKYVVSIIISALLLAAASLLGAQNSTVVTMLYVLSVASALCISTLHGIEALMDRHFDAALLRTAALLIIFFAGAYVQTAFAAILLCFADMIKKYADISLSKAYIKNNGGGLCYTLISGDDTQSVFAEKIKLNDRVIINDGDFLCFDCVYDNGKKLYSGVYSGESKAVTVTALYDYSVDFEQMHGKSSPMYKKIRLYYMLCIAFIAVVFAVVNIAFGGSKVILSLLTPAIILLLSAPEFISSGIAAYFVLTGKSNLQKSIDGVKNIVVNMSGVLTRGELTVGEVVCSDGYNSKDIISMCAAVQPNFDNKFAKAFLEYLGVGKIAAVPSKYSQGLGITADISGRKVLVGSQKLLNNNGVDCSKYDGYTVYVAVDGIMIAAVKMNDVLSADACKAMHELKNAGYNTYMVTANNTLTAKAAAENCSAEYTALCTDKAGYINSVKKGGKTVYIGDDDAAANAADIALKFSENGDIASLSELLESIKQTADTDTFAKIRVIAGLIISAALILAVILNVLGAGILWLIALIVGVMICLPEYAVLNMCKKK